MSLLHAYRNALPAGARLLWYRVERVLGQGAYGITYLAHDENLRRPAAIKEYLPGHLARREADARVEPLSAELAAEYGDGLRRFLSEARTLARFEHPNIVRVHHVFEQHGTACMVMRHEDGETLERLLRERGCLDEAFLAGLLPGLLDGLAAIHREGCIHRDVKPANVLVRPDGTPLLLDFGAARFARAGEARTLTNFVSPGYAAIEQYAGKSDSQGPWTDLYGLAATLYRALAGRPPPDAVERSQALADGQADPLRAAETLLAAGCSESFATALGRALAYRAEDRPRSVAAWRAESPALPDLGAPPGEPAPGTMPATTVPAAPATSTAPATLPTRRPRAAAIPPGRGRRTRLLAVGLVLSAVVATLALAPNALRRAPVGTPAPAPAPGARAPLAEAAAPATPDLARAARIETLLAAAAADYTAARLTLPPGENAYDKYREVLALAPDHPAATQGLAAIAQRYVELAQRELDRGRLRQAGLYLRKSAALDPDLATAAAVREDLRRASASVEQAAAEAGARSTADAATADTAGTATAPTAGGRGLFGWFGVGKPSARAPIEDRSRPVPPARP